MKVLGIETSCDETGVCIIDAQGNFGADFSYQILGNALYSQVAIHAPYGGVFPNLAKREHAKNLVPLMSQALDQAGLLRRRGQTSAGTEEEARLIVPEILAREPELLEQWEVFFREYEKPDIDCIAVTHGPGLEPALWVGVNFARSLALNWGVPLVAVNHMEGHVVMSMMQDDHLGEFEFPVLSLLISGGHTELVLSQGWLQYELLGATRDDAVGEAFDKVARLLDLPYPGGPEISRLAKEARELEQGETLLKFTPPMLHSGDYDFSFSGLKTEVRKYVEQHAPLADDMKKEIACAFENAVAEVLVEKTMKAGDEFGAQSILVGGGVSANTYIRHRLAEAIRKAPAFTKLLIPPAQLATDNALMIALAGYFHAIKGDLADPQTLKANGNLRLA